MSSSEPDPDQRSQRLLRILLIRHGETDHNVKGIIQGQLDTPLNALGRIQASLLGKALGSEKIDDIYASPLQRAADTAQAIYSSQLERGPDNPQRYLDDRLKERAFGSLEGHSFKGEKTDAIEGIEKAADLWLRLAWFWNDLIDHVQAGQRLDGSPISVGGTSNNEASSSSPYFYTVALVAHGASLSSLLHVLAPYSTLAEGVKSSRLWNCSITELVVGLEDEEWQDVPDERESDSARGFSRPDPKRWTIKPPQLLGNASRSHRSESKIRRLMAKLKGEKQHQNGSETENTEKVSDLYPILITRWADIRHLSPDDKGNDDTGCITQPIVHKSANADEITVEEKDEGRRPS